jgi:molybdopterin-containing oxidoreductase family membrane subunit
MSKTEAHVMGLFRSETQAVEAIKALRDGSPYRFKRAHSPIPSHKIMNALQLKSSKVGLFTLTGGIIGFFAGFGLAIFTATRWDLIVSGKPIVALIPFLIVGFEFTVLFAVFGNVVGLLAQTRLPSFKGLKFYDPRCSGEHFGVLAACEAERQEDLTNFFREKGGDPQIFESTE